MITIEAIHIAPVKSLGLAHPHTVHVEHSGIAEDRRLYLIDRACHLVTQRTLGPLVQITSQYQSDREWLHLLFPDGRCLEGRLELGEAVITRIWGRYVRGHVLQGQWNQALSDFCGEEVRLVRANEPGQCYDEFPISLVSQASLAQLSSHAGNTVAFDSRRFRPNFVLRGCKPHEEDEWLGSVIQIGAALRLHILGRDPRCVMTTLDPNTGQRDIDTLGYILGYRPNPVAAYFGVYGIVQHPGTIAIGDAVSTRPALKQT